MFYIKKISSFPAWHVRHRYAKYVCTAYAHAHSPAHIANIYIERIHLESSLGMPYKALYNESLAHFNYLEQVDKNWAIL